MTATYSQPGRPSPASGEKGNGEADVEKGHTSESSRRGGTDMIAGQNPFHWRGTVTDTKAFVGREHEFATIFMRLKTLGCVSVVGDRRIGKSSLLYQAAARPQATRPELPRPVSRSPQRSASHARRPAGRNPSRMDRKGGRTARLLGDGQAGRLRDRGARPARHGSPPRGLPRRVREPGRP